MNADKRTSGQKEYGQQSPQEVAERQTGSQPNADTSSQDQQDEQAATGQAAYGNSGEALTKVELQRGIDSHESTKDSPPDSSVGSALDVQVERSQGHEHDVEGRSL